MHDGNATYVACDGNNGLILESPNPLCTLGTTAFVSYGDVNGDGLRDSNTYWSISNITPAFAVAPFLPTQCALAMAPPSSLPRPLTPIQDQGLILFYNVLTASVKQYNIATYAYSRTYGNVGTAADMPTMPAEWSRMNNEVVIGNYIFTFPSLAKPGSTLPIPTQIYPFVEGYAKSKQGIVSGLRINNGSWFNGNYQIDPRLIQTIKWEGNNTQNISPTTDQLYFSIRQGGATDLTESAVEFPGGGTSGGGATPLSQSLLLTNSLVTSYSMPPYFFTPGQKGVIHLDFVRSIAASSVAKDNSTRTLRAGVFFVDSYNGFVLPTFPSYYPSGLAVPPSATAANGDYDGDGVSNLVEFAFGSDPTDPLSKPTEPLAKKATPIAMGYVQRIIPKRPNTGTTLTYNYEWSNTNGPIWTKITPGINWKVTEPTNALGVYDPAGAFVTIRSTIPWAPVPWIRVTPVNNPLPAS